MGLALDCVAIALSLTSVPTLQSSTTRPALADTGRVGSAAALRPIEPADAAAWKSIGSATLSRNGEWFGYVLRPNEGNAELIVRATKTDQETRFALGELGRSGGGSLSFSHDSRWVAFPVAPSKAEADKLRKQQKPIQNGVAVVELATGKRADFPRVRRFTFDGKRSATLAIHLLAEPAGTNAAGRGTGSDLILYDLAAGSAHSVGNVAEFAFDASGKRVAWTVDAKDQIGNGLILRDLETGIERPLDGDRAWYRGLAWADSSSDRLVLLKGKVDSAVGDTLYQVVAAHGIAAGTPQVFGFKPSDDPSFPRGMTIGVSRTPRWSKDLATIFFGIRPIRVKQTPDTAGAEKPNLVLWHWKEPRLQSQQQVERARDDAFTYLAAYRVNDRRFVRIADDSLPEVAVAPKDQWALAWDERAYATQNSLDGKEYVDLYVINLATGARRRAMSRYLIINGFGRQQYYAFSPNGTHYLTWANGAYTVHDMATGKSHPLVPAGGPSFVDVDDDHPRDRPPLLPRFWSADGSNAIMSDEWDLWAVAVDGSGAVNLTVNGRKSGIRYSSPLLSLTSSEGFAGTVDLSKAWYATARDHWRKSAGIVRIEGRTPGATRVLWGEASYSAIKAAEADVVAFSKGTPVEFPDYHLTNLAFESPKRLTDANPQQKDHLWPSGTVVVDYTGPRGERLQASLLLPANYEPGKKYPAVMHIYEHRSQNRISYEGPSYDQALNGTLYASRGYVVISPDINYIVDAPGTSSLKCVTAAARAAIATGIVDPDRIGLTGHSWGGYQTAFLVTQTPLFKAAVAGAAPTNMISFYGDIYWSTGRMIAPIFEADQARLSKPYWDDMAVYIRESAVYHAKNVKTPLLILNNDKDAAVDWHQGIEYYNVLRRLGKPAVMLQYVGEGHGLSNAANQRDYATRMREFFDHFLTGAPAPDWWTEGVPFRKMDEHLRGRTKSSATAAAGH